MRHIATLIAALFIGPLAWILIAFGQDRSAAAFAKAQENGAFDTGDFVRPLIFLAVAGVLVGLIATLRFSPLGAVVTGTVYVLSYVWLLIDPAGLLDVFKRNLSIFGQTADPTLPVRTGTTLIIGALLLVSVVSVKRWRRWPQPAPAGSNLDDPTGGLDQFGALGLGTRLDETGYGGGLTGGSGLSSGLGGKLSGNLGSAFGGGTFGGGESSTSTDDRSGPSSPLASRLGTSSSSPLTEPLAGSTGTPYDGPLGRRTGEARIVEPRTASSGPASATPAGSPWTTPPRDNPDEPAH